MMSQDQICDTVAAYAAEMEWDAWDIADVRQHPHSSVFGIRGIGWLVEVRLRLSDPELLRLRREGLLRSGADLNFVQGLPPYVETDAGLVIEDETGRVQPV